VSKKLPADIIEHWPEILKDVEIKAVPIEYLDSINVHFFDGKIWEIDLKNESNVKNLEETLETFFNDYDDSIKRVDFSINTARVKKDVQARTRSFMKKKK
tara:strand:- start:39266 stop:39565 length:300 start_codon:yes stop_codon:yes gene_type:complete